MNASIHERFKKTDKYLHQDLREGHDVNDTDSERLSEMIGELKREKIEKYAGTQEMPQRQLQFSKERQQIQFTNEGAFNENKEFVYDKRTIAYAMPKGEFSSDSE